MASSKERARWERWYIKVNERMERQKRSLTRVVLLLTECTAALAEISEMDGSAPDGQTTPLEYAQERARRALAVVNPAAAAEMKSAEELVAEPDPEDPRSN